jgi:cation:H+ antiporter
MFDLVFWIIVFIVSLAILIKASDYFTDSAEKIGLHFKMPAFIVGVTIVAIGTSLPELISSIIAVFASSPEIIVGNVIGSNITNIFLIIGITAIVGKKIGLSWEIKHVDIPFLIGSAFLLAMVLLDGVIGLLESILLLAVLIVYICYTISSREKRQSQDGTTQIKKEIKKEKELLKESKRLSPWVWIILVLGAVFIYLGAQFTIVSIINLSSLLGVGAGIIALTALALGTSLPELVVSITAAKKGQPEMAIGNVLGSNIFNSLAVISIPGIISVVALATPITFTFSIFIVGALLVATILYYFVVEDKQITKWEGALFILFYLFFIFATLGIA